MAKTINIRVSTPDTQVLGVEYNKKNIIESILCAKKDKKDMIVFPLFSLETPTFGELVKNRSIIKSIKKAEKDIFNNTKDIEVLLGSIDVDKPFAVGIKDCNVIYKKYFNNLNGDAYKYLNKNNSEKSMSKFKYSVLSTNDILNFSLKSYVKFNKELLIVMHDGSTTLSQARKIEKILTYLSKKLSNNVVLVTPNYSSSTTDMVYINHNAVFVRGDVHKNEYFSSDYLDVTLNLEGKKELSSEEVLDIKKHINDIINDKILFVKNPFSPDKKEDLLFLIEMQSRALAKRIEVTKSKKLIVGVSGGLDSTLALLVAARAVKINSMPSSAVLAITMPCFGTSKRTRSNAEILSTELGCEFKEIDITNSIKEHFIAIDHSNDVYDAAYENAQARERTQVLMDMANMESGLVIGTGDLSELALGWATYNGDHMSNYSVNSSIPKTLMQEMLHEYAVNCNNVELKKCILDIINTPISPELLPANNGEVAQPTEQIIGPYELHDYFLYYGIFKHQDMKDVYKMAVQLFGSKYTNKEIKKYMQIFYKRFVTQQFKRSCLPDGPNVTGYSLSPRCGFIFPSDTSPEVFMSYFN